MILYGGVKVPVTVTKPGVRLNKRSVPIDDDQRLKQAARDLLGMAESLEQETRDLAASSARYPEREIARKLKLAHAYRISARTLETVPYGGSRDDMVAVARLRHSLGTNRRAANKLVRAANDAGYTLRSLAQAIGVSHAYLSQAAAGTKRIRLVLAQRVEQLTGGRYQATVENWPKGWTP